MMMLWMRSVPRYGFVKSSRISLSLKNSTATTATRTHTKGFGTSSHKPTETNFFRNPIGWYSHKLDTNPIITKCISAGCISGVGQIISQRIIYDPKSGKDFNIDWYKAARFMVLNVVFVAPVLHYWYVFLDKAVPGTQMIPVIKRVFFDEFVFTPPYIALLMGLVWGMEGNKPSEIPKMIGAEFWNIMIFDWSVYIPVQLVNFRYFPVKYQVLVINICGVGWNTFVSWRASHQEQQQLQLQKQKDGNKKLH
mmetsp:Transcript_20534/g.29688  ORF Transcript_20534/g.29688 Transcript_20534/m.29688 type:complete len:251 (-) Transcript_20534:172-924(-)|eukprot:CAMPEP_0202445862 /NCGR_PEP_ID=MMETSP1360-20130828/4592_1 /ASSEMBLY_ACC=CAM_ASM_000848 /TAXON_ID=515479 /ORGANISM="Licmophora paradoxa, Strain CCMP2313" /LENGTH=250 /DNA_ID=CAMNT_0049062261 /DNA_START=18 /DNA_END=770 /DNA_ORIENTATION=-